MPAKKKTQRLKVEEIEEAKAEEVDKSPDIEKGHEVKPEKEKREDKKKTATESEKGEGAEEVRVSSTEEKKNEPKEGVSSETKISTFKMADVKDSKLPDLDVKTEEKESDTSEELSETKEAEEKQPEAKQEETADSSEKAKEWLSDIKPEQESSTDSSEGEGKKKYLIIAFILVVLGAIVGGGIYYYQTKVASPSENEIVQEKKEIQPTPTITEEKDEQDKATESASIDFSKLGVNVLNGSGIAGEAGKVAKLLEDLDFKKVETGNAETYDYVETEIRTKEKTEKGVYENIKNLLSESYIVVKGDTDLDSDYDYDVEIIVGNKKL